MGILTTTVGSFPKPVRLRRARWRFAEEEIDRAALAAEETRARNAVLALQKKLGLEPLVDGQMDRGDMVGDFVTALGGVEEGGLVRCWGNRYYRRPRVVGELEYGEPQTVESWKAARKEAGRSLRATITGPYTLMDWSFDEHYTSRDKCCLAFADAVRREAEALLAAGATEIQLDEPALGVRPGEIDLAHEALARVTKTLRGRARSWLWAGYGDIAPVLPDLFDLPVDVLLLEAVNSGFRVDPRLASLPADKMLGLGVVDALDGTVETVETIRGRIEQLLEAVPADRLVVAPDAGLRALTEKQAAGKLEAMVEAVRSL